MKIETISWADVNSLTAAIDILLVRIYANNRRLLALHGKTDRESIAEHARVLAEQKELGAEKRELRIRRDGLKKQIQGEELHRAFGLR